MNKKMEKNVTAVWTTTYLAEKNWD